MAISLKHEGLAIRGIDSLGASYDEASIIAGGIGRELEGNWNSVDNLTMKSSDKTTAILNKAVGIEKIDSDTLKLI